jgi:hypothetical protein
LAGAGQRRGLERPGVGRALAHACHPPGGGGGKTAAACGDPTAGPDAPQRAGATAQHRRSTARGGPCPRAHSASGGRMAPRRLGQAGRAEHAIGGPGARFSAPRAARDPANPLPPHAYHASGRHQRCSPPTVGGESLWHPCGAHAAVLAGGGGGLASCIPRGTPLPPPPEPRPSRPAGGQAQRAHGGPHVPADTRGPWVHGPSVCPATVAGDSPGQPPQVASSEQAQDDRQANGRADPPSLCGHGADEHHACGWRGQAASAHTLVRVTGR